MKIIKIGRDPQCDIYYNDEQISRHHAFLKIHTFGKIEIVDNSANGTFVNQARISSGVPYPLSRKNIVTFGNTKQLDWDDVPNPFRTIKIILFLFLVVVSFFALYFFDMIPFVSKSKTDTSVDSEEIIQLTSDTLSSTNESIQIINSDEPQAQEKVDEQEPLEKVNEKPWYEIIKEDAKKKNKKTNSVPKEKNNKQVQPVEKREKKTEIY